MAVFLFSAIALAQESKTEKFQRNFLALTAGPSFPIGDFASTNWQDNKDAGLAKTGFTIDLKYGHQINRVFGIKVNGVYGRYAVDKTALSTESGLSVDPWQYFGVLAGPMISGKLSSRTYADFSVLSGVISAAFPKATLNGTELTGRDWSNTVPLKLAADARIGLTNSLYLFAGADYLYMKPNFKVQTISENGFEMTPGKQKMDVIGINAGIGFSF